MRAPPPLRNSRAKHLSICFLRLQNLWSCRKIKRRWHLHKLHRAKGNIDFATANLTLDTRVEDMINIPTAFEPISAREKPLMIASFPSGCSDSPNVRILQKAKLSRLFLSKRKYRLRHYDNNVVWDQYKKNSIMENKDQPFTTEKSHNCAETVNSIKKFASKDADVKVIFHGKNIIKQQNVLYRRNNENKGPEFIEFGPALSIRLNDYESLKDKKRNVTNKTQGDLKSIYTLLLEEPQKQNPSKSESCESSIEEKVKGSQLSSTLRQREYFTKYEPLYMKKKYSDISLNPNINVVSFCGFY